MATRRAFTLLLHKSKPSSPLLLKVSPRLPIEIHSKRIYTTFSVPRRLPAVPETTGNMSDTTLIKLKP